MQLDMLGKHTTTIRLQGGRLFPIAWARKGVQLNVMHDDHGSKIAEVIVCTILYKVVTMQKCNMILLKWWLIINNCT